MKNFIKRLSDGGLAEDIYAAMERMLEEADTTREEERLGAAFEFYDKHKSAVANVTLVDSFVYGSKWADAHPKSDTANKQAFIKKALQWLKSHIQIKTLTYSDVWDTSVVDVLVTDFTTVEEMEESFRKMMEE